MAGSYGHIVTRNGNLVSNETFVNMIENLGDAYEMAEELYGMIWYLAAAPYYGNPKETKEAVKRAQENYKRGLEMAKDVNRVLRS